jgi:hypothetical protein
LTATVVDGGISLGQGSLRGPGAGLVAVDGTTGDGVRPKRRRLPVEEEIDGVTLQQEVNLA